jgi:hypothetical protein
VGTGADSQAVACTGGWEGWEEWGREGDRWRSGREGMGTMLQYWRPREGGNREGKGV